MPADSFLRLSRFGCLLSVLLLATGVAPVRAQQEAVVEQLAPVIAAEDSRNFQPGIFRSALVAPDSLVRRLAALAAGRIGDPRATPLIVPLLSDQDSTVRVAAAFALGLLRDTAGARPLMDRITGQPALDGPTAQEAITALAKIGGPGVGAFFDGILGGSIVPSRTEKRPILSQIVLESWRLGADAPVAGLLPFLEDTAAGFRWRAAFTLGRLGAPAAANRLTVALRDPETIVRAMAARAFSRTTPTRPASRRRAWPASWCGPPPTRISRSGSTRSARSPPSAIPPSSSEIIPLLDDPSPACRCRPR